MKTKSRLQLYPLLRFALALIAGIMIGDVCLQLASYILWLLLFAISVVFVFIFRKPVVQSSLLLLSFCLLGAALISRKEEVSAVSLPQDDVAFEAIVMSRSVIYNKVLRFDMLVSKVGDRQLKHNLLVKASVLRNPKGDPELKIGDGIEAFAKFETPRNLQKNSHFDYLRWLKVHGYKAQTLIPYWQIESKQVVKHLSISEKIRLRALLMRQSVIDRLEHQITDEDELSLLAAMGLGEKSMLSKQMKEEFSQSGASHILALSGLHMSIIFALLLLFLGKNILGRIITLSCLWMFVLAVGMPPSAVRAATMLTICTLATLIHRGNISLNALSFAALVILVINPLTLWDVGFQMSFIAICSIYVFYQPLSDLWITHNRILRWFKATICLSIAAQIGTAPLVAYYFGRFSCYFILTNILVIPCITLILHLLIAALLLLPIQVVSAFILDICAKVTSLMYAFVKWVSMLPGSSIENIHLSFMQLIGIYLMIVSITLLLNYAKMFRHLKRLKPEKTKQV